MNTIEYDNSIAILANLHLVFHIFNEVACVDNCVDSYNGVYGTSTSNQLGRSVLIQLDMIVQWLLLPVYSTSSTRLPVSTTASTATMASMVYQQLTYLAESVLMQSDMTS